MFAKEIDAQTLINNMPIRAEVVIFMEKPLKILHGSLNERVLVELRSGLQYQGVLDGYDVPHMNLVLKKAEETLNNELVKKHENVILRGDNIIYISP